MGTPSDLPLAIPGTGPPAVPTPARGDPVPMDDVVTSQPVVAYFTFIQNNLNQLTGGKANQVMREAEQRHLQIMNEVLQGLRNEWNNRLVQKDQECEQRVQDAESKALAAINAAKERSEEIEARLARNQATYDAKIGELQAEANKLHNLKLDEERKRITKEFEASYAQTVDEAQQAIAAVRKQCEEQIAVEQARSIQVKAEFERYKVEMDEKINEAAAQNLTLQDQIDDLQSKLDILANAHRSGAPKSAAPRIETATGSGVPVFNISTPKAPVGVDYSGGDEVVQELKTPAVLRACSKRLYLVSIYDTERKQMLWNRADSNIEPSVYDQSAPAASSSSPKAASVTLVARDDRDLGDEADASSGRPDASAAADDSATFTSMGSVTNLKSPAVLPMNKPNSHPRGCAGLSFRQARSPSLVIARYDPRMHGGVCVRADHVHHLWV